MEGQILSQSIIDDPLFQDVKPGTQVWMSHADTIVKCLKNYEITGSTADVKAGAFHIKGEKTWGIQFHPEVYHTTEGTQMLEKFCCRTFADVHRTGHRIHLLRSTVS